MHTVHIMTRLLRAGSEENILLTSKGQIARGHEVTLMFGADSKDDLAEALVPEAKRIMIPNLVRPVSLLHDFRAFFEMRDALRMLRPDVVHTHQSKAGIIGRFAASAAGVPCVIHGVHILPFIGTSRANSMIYLAAERAAARVTDGFIHVSQGMLDGCLDNGVGRHQPHKIINSGFDIQRFKTAERPPDIETLLNVPTDSEEPIVLAMLAALEPRKRHLEMLSAVGNLIAMNPRVNLLVAGEGPMKDQIRQKAKDLSIEKQVHLLGYRSDPERILAASDICLLASGQEGLPRSVLQYVASGKPTVLFELPGVSVVAKNNLNAFVLPEDDWTGFAAAVGKLVHDPELRQEMAEANDQVDISPWNWEEMAPRTDAFYEEVMNASTALSDNGEACLKAS